MGFCFLQNCFSSHTRLWEYKSSLNRSTAPAMNSEWPQKYVIMLMSKNTLNLRAEACWHRSLQNNVILYMASFRESWTTQERLICVLKSFFFFSLQDGDLFCKCHELFCIQQDSCHKLRSSQKCSCCKPWTDQGIADNHILITGGNISRPCYHNSYLDSWWPILQRSHGFHIGKEQDTEKYWKRSMHFQLNMGQTLPVFVAALLYNRKRKEKTAFA